MDKGGTGCAQGRIEYNHGGTEIGRRDCFRAENQKKEEKKCQFGGYYRDRTAKGKAAPPLWGVKSPPVWLSHCKNERLFP